MSMHLFRMLDLHFGPQGWAVNEDPRFCSELKYRPIDIFAPLEQQEAQLEKIVAVQTAISKSLNINVFFTLTTPD